MCFLGDIQDPVWSNPGRRFTARLDIQQVQIDLRIQFSIAFCAAHIF